MKELRRVVGHSQLAIEKAMQAQQAFWARCVALTCVSLVFFWRRRCMMLRRPHQTPLTTTPTSTHPPTNQHSVEEQLPPAIALELAAAYRKQMANPPALASATPFPTTTTTEAGASSSSYSPLRAGGGMRGKGPEGALSQAVAEGFAAFSEREQQGGGGVAASEEAGGAKQSPGKRDAEGCVVM